MTSGFTLMPDFCTSAAASNTARACISEISGYTMPRRQPRKPEHRVELVEFLDALFDLLDGHAHLLGQVLLRGVLVREELVQRRVEEADGGREAFEGLEDAGEVALLVGQELGQGRSCGRPRCRRGSSRAWRRCGCLRRTCARCGSGRCRWRRRRRRFRSAPGCRRWCGPGGG